MSQPPLDEPSYDLIGESWPISSPILLAIPEENRLEKVTVCSTCPAAVWYLTVETMKCYCGPLRFLSFGATERAVRGCDAREMAIQKAIADAQNGD